MKSFRGVHPVVAETAYLADSATLIGAVQIAEEASVWFGAVLRGDVGKIVVGPRTNIQDNACLHMTHTVSDTVLGSDVIVGHNAVLHGALVGDGALIGIGSIVMDNARIGAGAWVAAGSVVPPGMEVPEGVLVRGSPARVARPVREQERVWAAGAVRRYLDLAAAYR